MQTIRMTLLITLAITGIALAKDKKQPFYSYPLNDARIAAAISVGNKASGRSISLSLSDSAQSWSRALIVYAFIGSTTLFAYPLKMSDGTTAWCHTGTVSVAMSWTFCCFLSALSVVRDATLSRFSRSRESTI